VSDDVVEQHLARGDPEHARAAVQYQQQHGVPHLQRAVDEEIAPTERHAHEQRAAELNQPPRIDAIVQRTRGRTNGPATRLMSPSDFGEILKPFVFLDLFNHDGAPFTAGLHPHSGIATLTYVAEGEISYIDPDNVRGTLQAGGVE